MKETILRTENLTKFYGRQSAVDNISLEIARGEIYGLIGLNGAGKTTFMKAVTGLIRVSKGRLELFGDSDEKGLQTNRRRIGQIIEYPALYPHMTARENVECHRILSGIPDPRKTDEVLETVELKNTGSKKAKNFSLGMKQRLGLAIALVSNPEFLILDEPVNGLDPQGIMDFRALVRKLVHEQGLTVLISSHLLDELAQLATLFGIIHQGRLIKQLTADELSMESRQHISISSNDNSRALVLIKEHFAIDNYIVTPSGEIRIMEQLKEVGKMNTLLVNEGIEVQKLHVTEQKLEDYFVQLIQEVSR